jgi:L-rhamnose mutarotase
MAEEKILAFKMKLKKGHQAEYKRRHDEIWPELKELLKRSGVYDYSIFLDEETDTLFAVQKVKGDGGSQELGKEPAVQRWWDYMADIMEVNPDHSPVSIPLKQLFYLP